MISRHFDIVANFFEENPSAYKSKYVGRSIFKVENVSTAAKLRKANNAIDNLPTKSNAINNNNISRVILNPKDQDNFNYFNLYFNEDGKAEYWDNLIEKCTSEENAIYPLAKDAIEFMAEKVKWKNQTVEMSINVLRYHLDSNKPIINNMPWHQDPDMLTMTMLISDYYNQESKVGFSGGSLNFCSVSDSYKAQPCSFFRKRDLDYDIDTLQTFNYPVNGGFIFDNLSSFHKVGDIQMVNSYQSKNTTAERRLLSIFTYSDTATDLVKLAKKQSDINLVAANEKA